MLAREQSCETPGWDVAVWHPLGIPSSALAELQAPLPASLPPKPTHSMKRLTCSAGSRKSPSNSSRAHCRGEMGVEHCNSPLCPQAQGEGEALARPAAALRLPAGSSWGRILPATHHWRGNGEGRQRSRCFLAGCCSWGGSAYLQCVLDGAGEVPQGAEGEGAIPGSAGWPQRLGQGRYHGQHIPPCPLRARVQQWCAAAETTSLQIGACREPEVLGTQGACPGAWPLCPSWHSRASSVSRALATPSRWRKKLSL